MDVDVNNDKEIEEKALFYMNEITKGLKLNHPPYEHISDIQISTLVEINCRLIGLSFDDYIPSLDRPWEDVQGILFSLQERFGKDKFQHLKARRIAEHEPLYMACLLEIFYTIFDHGRRKGRQFLPSSAKAPETTMLDDSAEQTKDSEITTDEDSGTTIDELKLNFILEHEDELPAVEETEIEDTTMTEMDTGLSEDSAIVSGDDKEIKELYHSLDTSVESDYSTTKARKLPSTSSKPKENQPVQSGSTASSSNLEAMNQIDRAKVSRAQSQQTDGARASKTQSRNDRTRVSKTQSQQTERTMTSRTQSKQKDGGRPSRTRSQQTEESESTACLVPEDLDQIEEVPVLRTRSQQAAFCRDLLHSSTPRASCRKKPAGPAPRTLAGIMPPFDIETENDPCATPRRPPCPRRPNPQPSHGVLPPFHDAAFAADTQSRTRNSSAKKSVKASGSAKQEECQPTTSKVLAVGTLVEKKRRSENSGSDNEEKENLDQAPVARTSIEEFAKHAIAQLAQIRAEIEEQVRTQVKDVVHRSSKQELRNSVNGQDERKNSSGAKMKSDVQVQTTPDTEEAAGRPKLKSVPAQCDADMKTGAPNLGFAGVGPMKLDRFGKPYREKFPYYPGGFIKVQCHPSSRRKLPPPDRKGSAFKSDDQHRQSHGHGHEENPPKSMSEVVKEKKIEEIKNHLQELRKTYNDELAALKSQFDLLVEKGGAHAFDRIRSSWSEAQNRLRRSARKTVDSVINLAQTMYAEGSV